MRRLLPLLVAIAALSAPASAGALGIPLRESDPVVFTGADVPPLLGADPGRIVAFSWDGRWRQAPVQVDERAMVDYAAVRHGNQTAGRPFRHLAYTDPGTLAGPDPQPALDDDDEIAMMAMDVGKQPPAGAGDPKGVVPGSRSPVRISDPLAPGLLRFVYLYRSRGGLDPSAGRSYVDYDFELLSGDYRTTYDFDGVPNGDDGSGGPSANPERSTVTTPFYSERLLSRWIGDQLRITAGGASGVDILDGDKAQVNFGCQRAEVTFARGGGGFIANKSGPVRAIRSYIGANSGTYTQRDHVYYQRAEVATTYLRVHPGINVISQFLDYSPAAGGMTYRNSRFPAGVTIDGSPDPPLETGSTVGAPFTWEQLSGAQGTVTVVNRMRTDIPGVTQGSYYEDTTTPQAGQCDGYADKQAWGASGPAVSGTGQNTDPTLGDAYDFTGTRTSYFSAPGGDAVLAAVRARQADAPLMAMADPLSPLRLRTAPKPRRVRPGKLRLHVRVRNLGADATGRVRVCAAPAKRVRKLVRPLGCGGVDDLAAGEAATPHFNVLLRRAARPRRVIPIEVVARGASVETAHARVRIKVKPH